MNPEHQSPQMAILFHTAFCCSTLFAKSLAQPGQTVCLLEPLALRDLADSERKTPLADDTIKTVLRLLNKAQGEESSVLIKPSNLVNTLGTRILDVDPNIRAILLTNSLEEFLISCSKKPDTTRQNMPMLLQSICQGSDFLERKGLVQGNGSPVHLDYHSICALVWLRQQEIAAQIIRAGALRIEMSELLARPDTAIASAAEFLNITGPSHAHITSVFSVNAKEPSLAYGPDKKASESKLVQHHFGKHVERAVHWLNNLPG